jgi:hypothetical protein
MIPGQITLESPFGKVLTDLAKGATSVMEIGTWNGGGSTSCLIRGMKEGAKLLTLESDPKMFETAQANLLPWIDAYKVTARNAVASRQIVPYFHPDGGCRQVREAWENENRLIQECQLIQNDNYEWARFLSISGKIDLLLLDGGEFTTMGDFLTLWQYADVIALDDTNMGRSVKNVWAREALIKAGWTVLHDHIDDRNGWFVARRVK